MARSALEESLYNQQHNGEQTLITPSNDEGKLNFIQYTSEFLWQLIAALQCWSFESILIPIFQMNQMKSIRLPLQSDIGPL